MERYEDICLTLKSASYTENEIKLLAKEIEQIINAADYAYAEGFQALDYLTGEYATYCTVQEAGAVLEKWGLHELGEEDNDNIWRSFLKAVAGGYGEEDIKKRAVALTNENRMSVYEKAVVFLYAEGALGILGGMKLAYLRQHLTSLLPEGIFA